MSFLEDAVVKLEDQIYGSGCDDSPVVLKRNPDAPRCQYIRGAGIDVLFGGRQAHITTNYPVEATTRVSFMFGAGFDTPEKRAAACAILNAVMKFLCIGRIPNACRKDDYTPCLSYLSDELEGARVFCTGTIPHIHEQLGNAMVETPEEADVILVAGDGIFSKEGASVIDRCLGAKRVLFIGPETAGIATLLDAEHWCPFGRI